MGKVKDFFLHRDKYTVGTLVKAYTHRRCGKCSCWFKFRFDEAVNEIREAGYFMVMCPECDSEFVYEDERHLPEAFMKFIEVE